MFKYISAHGIYNLYFALSDATVYRSFLYFCLKINNCQGREDRTIRLRKKGMHSVNKSGQREYNGKWFNALLIALTCVFSMFYARYSTLSPARSRGDIQLHTLVAKALLFQDAEYDNSFFPVHAYTYPVYHFVQKMVHLFLQIDYETAAAIVLTISIVISVLLYRKLVLMMVKDTVQNRYFADLLSIGAVFFETARCPLNHWRYYQLQCAANPFHNPTILFVRPFAIASFILFIQMINSCKQRINYKYMLQFSLITLISVGAKPSYAIVFLPAMGIYTLCYIARTREWRLGGIALVSVLPSLLLLVIQQKWMSLHTEAINIRIKFGFFTEYVEFGSQWELLSEVIGASLVTFPVVILLFRVCLMKKDAFYPIAIIALVIGWLQMFFLKTGMTGDFSWGYDLAVQFATLISLAETRNEENRGGFRKIITGITCCIFVYQVLVGFMYIREIYITDAFWI